MTPEYKRIQRDDARAFVERLSRSQIGDLIDAMVLGTFEWIDWLDHPRTSAFWSAVFREAQYREEIEG